MIIRLGTRASALARCQADWVAGQLRALGLDVELVPITTSGDRQQGPIQDIGQGVFTKEIQRALLDGRIDLAVHSLKDLPTDAPADLILAAVPKRAPCGDVLLSPQWKTLDQLPAGAVVGTSSVRRRAQLLNHRADLQMKDIRGNVDTRLRKLREGQYDALVLADAGLTRLGLTAEITQSLPMSIIMPAVGQGALGLETRADDSATRAALAQLDHSDTHSAVLAERAMLAALKGGCLAPVAAWARIENDLLALTGRVLSPDGQRKLEAGAETLAPSASKDKKNLAASEGEKTLATTEGATADAKFEASVELGRRVAGELLRLGAEELIELARSP
jgi:hydroxymethylbilane synthase